MPEGVGTAVSNPTRFSWCELLLELEISKFDFECVLKLIVTRVFDLQHFLSVQRNLCTQEIRIFVAL